MELRALKHGIYTGRMAVHIHILTENFHSLFAVYLRLLHQLSTTYAVSVQRMNLYYVLATCFFFTYVAKKAKQTSTTSLPWA